MTARRPHSPTPWQATPHVFWLTGLSASGKSTLAQALESRLQALNIPIARLDGDELRTGLCADLGLDDASRSENIRRAGEVAKLMHTAGLSVVCAFVSPFKADRERVRKLFLPGRFSEIYLSTPLEECIRRDPKGLYARAQRGELCGLTGWDAPYEAPQTAEFTFDTRQITLNAMLDALTGSPTATATSATPANPTPAPFHALQLKASL